MPLEQQNIEQNEVSKEIDSKLANLEARITENDVSSNYEKKENWKFNLKINWVTLDIDIEDSKLPSVLKLTQDIIMIYIKAWYKDEKLYPEESITTKGCPDRASLIDIKIDNRILFDTTLLSEEWFVKNFKIDPSRSNWIMWKYIDFLNQVIESEIKLNQ